jgi:Tol biopolymer transport system component
MRLRFLFSTAGLVVVLTVAGVTQSRPAWTMLEAARKLAVVDGDLPAAIAQYQAVVETYGKTDHAAAATALLRMAEAYQTLGSSSARRAYEQILRDYPDQAEAVATANIRLRQTSAQGASPSDRVVRSGPEITWGDGRISPDGRFICYTDWDWTGNLMLHDLGEGHDRPLTGNKDWTVGNATSCTFSPDGTRVAYGWRTYPPSPRPGASGASAVDEIRIGTVTGTGTLRSEPVYRNPDINSYDPTDWSPDGRLLAVHAMRKDRTGEIALVGVEDGSFRVLKSTGWRGPDKVFFSPDGRFLAYDLPASDSDAQRDLFVMAIDGSVETRVVSWPSSDVVMAWAPDGRILFASDRTGATDLWGLPMAHGRPDGAPSLVKPNIGTVLSQGLTASGALYVVKDASTESLQVAPIDLARGVLSGPAVLENFRSRRPDWSPDNSRLAYVTTDVGGRPALTIRALASGQIRQIHPPLLYMAEPRWYPNGQSLAVAGRDFNGRGVIYRIDADTGQSTFLSQGPAVARVQIDPNGTVVWGQLISGKPFPAPARAGVTFGNHELSPDGRFFAVVAADAQAGTSSLLLVPSTGGEPRELFRVDPPHLLWTHGNVTWTPDSKAVLVAEALTMSEYHVEPTALWLVPTDGSPARKLGADISSWSLDGLRLSPSGRQIAFFVGGSSREVWALEHVAPQRAQHRQP